jgi:hypothetical protein
MAKVSASLEAEAVALAGIKVEIVVGCVYVEFSYTKLLLLTQVIYPRALGSRGHCQNCINLSSGNKDFILLVGRCPQMAVCFSKRSTCSAF